MSDSDAARREREVRLLLVCGRVALDAAVRDTLLAALAEPFDWDSVIARALRHGLLPLLHKHLSAMPSETVPPEVLSQLNTRVAEITRTNLRLTAEMLRLTEAFRAAGLTAVPLKGPVLAQAVYGSVALRQFSDLDFLVSPQALRPIKDILVSLGYAPDALYWDQNHEVLSQSYYHFSFYSQAQNCLVEIHHRLYSPCLQTAQQVQAILGRCASLLFMGRNVPGLSPEDQFLFLCAHGVRHVWERMEWVCGIAEIVRGGSITDWPTLLAQAHGLGMERILLSSLLLAESLGGVPVPAALAEAAGRDHAAKQLADRAAWRLLQGQDRVPEAGERFLYSLQAYPRSSDRCKYLWFHLTAPKLPDVGAEPRPLRLLRTYGASLVRAVQRNKS